MSRTARTEAELSETLREQMLASATDVVNALCTYAHDQPRANFDAREAHVLKAGRALLATWLGQLASAAGPRNPACPQCGVHTLNAVRRQRKPRTVNRRCGTGRLARVPVRCQGLGHTVVALRSALGSSAHHRTQGA